MLGAALPLRIRGGRKPAGHRRLRAGHPAADDSDLRRHGPGGDAPPQPAAVERAGRLRRADLSALSAPQGRRDRVVPLVRSGARPLAVPGARHGSGTGRVLPRVPARGDARPEVVAAAVARRGGSDSIGERGPRPGVGRLVRRARLLRRNRSVRRNRSRGAVGPGRAGTTGRAPAAPARVRAPRDKGDAMTMVEAKPQERPEERSAGRAGRPLRRHPSPWGWFAAGTACAVVALVWLAYGVRPLEMLRFAAYLALGLAVPGTLLWRALGGPRGPFVQEVA